MPLLELDAFGVELRGNRLLEGIDLEVPKGGAIGIAGGASSGKSVLALSLCGMLPPEATVSGLLRFDRSALPAGNEAAMSRLRGQRIGAIFGDGRMALDPRLSLQHQIAPRNVADGGAVDELLSLAALTGRADARPAEMSELERRKAMLLAAVARHPDLLVADEPGWGLDPVGRREVLDLLAALRKRFDFALVALSRDHRIVAMLAEEAVFLDRGRVIESGPAEAAFGRPQQERTHDYVAASKLRMRTLSRPPIGLDLLVVRGVGLPGRAESDISFRVRRNETLVVLGGAGSGKSLVGRIVAGVERAPTGVLEYEHDNYHGLDLPRHRRREIGLIFGDAAASFDPDLPVGAALTEALRLEPQLLDEEQGERLLETIRVVGLEPDGLKRLPGALSADVLARLAIARALITRPKMVVADKPGANLDLEQRAAVLELLARIRSDYGLTVLVLTRDFDVARALADRVVVLADGKIVEEGKSFELLDEPKHPATQAMVDARLPEVWNITPSGAAMG